MMETNQCGQIQEIDYARSILVHTPGVNSFMGTLHPNGSLYEQSVDIIQAQKEHELFVEVLKRKSDLKVLKVEEILKSECECNIVERIKLENFAKDCLTYILEGEEIELTEEDKNLVSDKYKESCLQKMSIDQLVDIILTNPIVKLKKSDFNTRLTTTTISFSPLSNLVFCRDQQITTQKGIIMGRLYSATRSPEKKVMKFCFEKLGLKIIGEITPPGLLEGGDFFPLTEELCLIGIGLRTNMHAVTYCMEHDLFGTKKVAVVKDLFDWNQQRMHLDTIFNVVNSECVVLLETIRGKKSPWRRLVDEYEKNSEGKYILVNHDVEFEDFLLQQNFHIIYFTQENQMNYGINFLNLGERLICVDKDSARKIAKDPHVKEVVEFVDFQNITTMYGAAHCCTQVLYREPRKSRKRKQKSQPNLKKNIYPIIETKRQATDTLLMIPPTCFYPNQASTDNLFLRFQDHQYSREQIQRTALKEFSTLHNLLVEEGINVHLLLNENRTTPDSCFPSIQFSTHPSQETPNHQKTLVLYPQSLRAERNKETILDKLKQNYACILDFTEGQRNAFLESTSSLVLDRVNKNAFLSISKRSNLDLAKKWCSELGYNLIHFQTSYHNQPVHHTSMMLSIASKFVVFCSAVICNEVERSKVLMLLSKTHEIIDITLDQFQQYCACILEVFSSKHQRNCVFMSHTAYCGFTEEQRRKIEKYSLLFYTDIQTLEKYGGNGLRGITAELF